MWFTPKLLKYVSCILDSLGSGDDEDEDDDEDDDDGGEDAETETEEEQVYFSRGGFLQSPRSLSLEQTITYIYRH